jgi:putative tryptophan/tyrosine transport system substrate-binding protein
MTNHIRRRDFISLLGSAAAAWPVAARAQQQPAIPVIGWLSGRNAESDAILLPGFRQGLNAQGFVEGRNVMVEYRWADGQYDRLPALAADLVGRRVAVIVASGQGELGTPAAQAASSTIPIVFAIGNDPVRLGLVASFNRPGGNVTGIVNINPLLGQKRLGFLHDLLPRATTIAVLVNPTNAPGAPEVTDVRDAARAIGLQIRILNASTERDLDTAFTKLAQMRADALFVVADPFFATRASRIVAEAARQAIPTMYALREFVVAGGLISYATSRDETFRKLGEYTGRILKGVKPADLPIDQSTKFELAINLKAAKALGLTIPETLLVQADEVIQ